MHQFKIWHVVRHVNDKFSVQDAPQGAGTLLNVTFDPCSEREATLVCSAANAASFLKLADAGPVREALEVLQGIGEYTGEGPMTTPWQDIVRAMSVSVHLALKKLKAA